jgi:hypothetical protein
MNPRRLLESGWHKLTRVGAKPDAQDYAQMTPEELKKQLQIIKDLQESQRQQTLELEQKKTKEENVFDVDEEKLIRHFKKIATGLKGEGCKFDWLEKPKTFDRTPSKYRQFKQLIQWYLYTRSDITKGDEKIIFVCSLLTEGTALKWKINYLLWVEQEISFRRTGNSYQEFLTKLNEYFADPHEE